MTRYPDFETGPARPAVGKFPYKHPTLAEIAEYDRAQDQWGRERQFRTTRRNAA